MLYQNILGERAPYMLFVSAMGGFPAHRHADIEFSYCLSGEFTVLLERRPYTVHAGELLLVAPMVMHEIPPSFGEGRRVLTGVLGASLLREDFAPFTGVRFPRPVCRPEELSGDSEGLTDALLVAAELASSRRVPDRLRSLSALYRIVSYFAEALPERNTEAEMGDLRGVTGIEPALEMIWHGYRAPLTVEAAAAATGYGKSNFCRIFRAVTGETFHHALNRRRIRAACDLLTGTSLPIATIGAEVGLPEPKTFCRVFREVEGVTPGAYRLSRA